jgi:Flp pilus assembly protein TadD
MEGIGINPNEAGYYLNRACIFLALRRTNEAISDFKQYLKLGGDNAEYVKAVRDKLRELGSPP